MAAAMSVTNVLTDVAGNARLEKRDLIPATLWIRIAVTVVFAAALLWQIARGVAGGDSRWRAAVRNRGPASGAGADILHLFDAGRGADHVVMWLYFRALQISPLSLSVPFLAFTPVFLIPSRIRDAG